MTMTKSILILSELLSEQIDELEEIASDYKLIYDIDEAKPNETNIILGWSNDLIPFIEAVESSVKWIQYPFAGVNSLPLDLFEEKDIILTNGSGIHQYAVAESAIGLLLGLTRNVMASARNQLKEEWVDSKNLYELHGKTMMIVGAGKIGAHLGQIAKGFGMKTIGINRSGRDIKNMDEHYVQEDLKDVIGKADVVVNILPATKETHHLFNSDMFDQMKNDVIYINVGRGESVDTDALLTALDNDKVLFAGLDVFEEEPLPKGHPLWSHAKVLITPHIAGRVENYPKHLYPIFKENLESFIQGKEITVNKVELENGY